MTCRVVKVCKTNARLGKITICIIEQEYCIDYVRSTVTIRITIETNGNCEFNGDHTEKL